MQRLTCSSPWRCGRPPANLPRRSAVFAAAPAFPRGFGTLFRESPAAQGARSRILARQFMHAASPRARLSFASLGGPPRKAAVASVGRPASGRPPARARQGGVLSRDVHYLPRGPARRVDGAGAVQRRSCIGVHDERAALKFHPWVAMVLTCLTLAAALGLLAAGLPESDCGLDVRNKAVGALSGSRAQRPDKLVARDRGLQNPTERLALGLGRVENSSFGESQQMALKSARGGDCGMSRRRASSQEAPGPGQTGQGMGSHN